MSAARFLNRRVVYRTRQFWLALQAKPPARDLAQIQDVLNPSQAALFTRLQLSEQAHSLQVYTKLKEKGATHPDLLSAALLHDVGKCLAPLRLWERVAIVLAKAICSGQVKRWGEAPAGASAGRVVQAGPQGGNERANGDLRTWRRPFIIAEQHPEWGARLAEQAGASPLCAALIRRHQENLRSAQDDAASLTCHPERSEGSPATEEEIVRFLHILQSADDES
jgi:hypothetical protein